MPPLRLMQKRIFDLAGRVRGDQLVTLAIEAGEQEARTAERALRSEA